MADTTISWSEKTWNPVVGCSKVSEGCRNCYAMRVAYGLERRFRQEKYAGTTKRTPRGPQWTGLVRTAPEALELPLRWRKPAKVFVNSMSDLFHEAVPFEFVAAVFGVMAATPRHTYQVLTKRPARMLEFFRWIPQAVPGVYPTSLAMGLAEPHTNGRTGPRYVSSAVPWPLPNVWLGVTVEDQRAADERVPLLLAAPAAVRFLSCEPLLGPLDIAKYLPDRPEGDRDRLVRWVIVGGESGPKARLMKAAWVDSLRRQCGRAGVPFFFKQTGSALARQMDLRHPKGEDPAEWPEAWRVQEFPLEVAP